MRFSHKALAAASRLAGMLLAGLLIAAPARADRTAAADSVPATLPVVKARSNDLAPRMLVRPPVPILLDPTDLGLGSTVVFEHVPDAKDLNDLAYLPSVQHVVLTLPEWPEDYARLEPMQASLFPDGADLIVVLPGYPRTHAAIAAWNLVHRPLRIVVVVAGPPLDRSMILELNALRGLERVICDMQEPSRSGFERLQRPLSFRVFRP